MSVEAITWALGQQAPSSTSKFVLVVLANCARAEDGMAWPSIAYLCEATQQNRKTVIANLGRLETALLVRRAGLTGKTNQVIVYQLAVQPFNSPDNGTGTKNGTGAHKAKSPKSGTGTENGTVPDLPGNNPVFDAEQSQFSPETVPKTGHGTVRNPKGTVIEPEDPSGLVASPDGSAPYRVPSCPNEELVALFHQHLPALPAVEVLSEGRKRALSARWREVCAESKFDRAAGLEWFAWFFGLVASSKFLTGQQPGRSGRLWKADFDFVLKPDKFVRIVEGVYNKESGS